jgi:hypothetical protein
MGAPDLRSLVHVGYDVLTTTVSAVTKKIRAQLGDVHHQTTDTDNAEWWQHIGFASRPPKPVAGKQAAQVVAVRAADHDICIASQDLRGLDLYGSLDHGETCVYAPGENGTGQARALFKKNGSISLYTRVGNSSSGAGMIVQLDAENDAIRITNGAGHGLIIDGDGVRVFAKGSGALTISSSGTCSLVATQQCQVDGSTVLLGSIAAPGVNAICVGPAGIAAAGSAKCFASLA